jgi:hypothetical protein
VTTGSLQTFAETRWYYYVSNRTAVSNGQSFLYALKTLLDASTSLMSTTWTVTLHATTFKLQISHNNGSSREITFSATLLANLGFATPANRTVASGATLTADYPSVWFWTPNMPISGTGPIQFDPAINYGVPTSVGTAHRAPDMTPAYVSNGVQWEAEYLFNGVEFYYKAREYGHVTASLKNLSFETWWNNGPRKGRRLLFWRDRANVAGSNAPSEGAASPYNYIEYAPQRTTMGALNLKPSSEHNLNYHDIKLDLWVTENGETPLTD